MSQPTKLPCDTHCVDPLWCIQRHGLCKRNEERSDKISTLRELCRHLLAALEGLIENAQPDNWDDDDNSDQADAWRAAFRAVCKAKGLPVPKNMEAADGR